MGTDQAVQEVAVAPRSTRGFREVLDRDDFCALEDALERFGASLGGRRVWHVNSTAEGGGVAELLSALLPYAAGVGTEVRWLVVEGNGAFFDVTKRIHNYLHDSEGDGGPLAERERQLYDESLARESDALRAVIEPGDVAVLHDPQTAGLIPVLKRHGVAVVWRCHVGVDTAGRVARAGWDFLRSDVATADAVVFSRSAFAWDGLSSGKVGVIAPCIDVLSPKNRPLDDAAVRDILRGAGIIPTDNGEGRNLSARAEMIEREPLPSAADVVVQVSRWDRLKDPAGLIKAFLTYGGPADHDAHLVVAGPATDSVDDDPESTEVFAEVRSLWEQLSEQWQRQVHLACLPMDDPDENSTLVNALQRRADVVAQKSLAEGFGLTVAEAMWKERPVVASRVGGIQDQIVHGNSGTLIDDPRDVDGFGRALGALLTDDDRAKQMGVAARERICEGFLPLHHFAAEANLFEQVLV